MEKLDVVCSEEGYVIARVKKVRIGDAVVDEKGRIVGRVTRIFGPVSYPYIRVRIQRRGGRELYLGGDRKWKKKRKRRSG